MKLNAVLVVLSFCGLYSHAEVVDILRAGAVSDGLTLNTQVIQKAINDVSEAGGGQVVFPAGDFVTGSLEMKSGVTLLLKNGARLLGSESLADYPEIQPVFVALRTGQPTRQLIYSEGQENIAIVGEGTIDGRGGAFLDSDSESEPGVHRPHLIQFISCKNILIDGVRLLNSAGWMQHYLACENLTVKNIYVYNHCNYNNDGIDIDGCKDVVVSGCIIDSDDDGICLKSTSPEPCRNVSITNCIVKSHCNALKLGTESTGGFQNIVISNCTVSPSDDPDPFYGTIKGQSAISVEMVDGGLLDGVIVSNITISDTDCPIFIRLGNRARKYSQNASEPGIGILRNVSISNIVATTSSKLTSSITGIPGACAEGISLNNIIITSLSEGTVEDAQVKVRENDKGYPTPNMFGEVLPASGFFVRHVKNISFSNIQIFLKGENVRPVFVFEEVTNAIIINSAVSAVSKKVRLFVADKKSGSVRIINK